MKAVKMHVLVVMAGMIVFSCGPKMVDKQEQLQSLETQRQEYQQKITEINAQIAALREAIIAEGGVVDDDLRDRVAVSTEPVRQGQFRHFIEIQGNVESDNNIFIPAESPGIVRRIYVDEGDKVSKGQVLAELDADILLKTMEEIQINLDLAKTVYERQKRLWDQNIGSEIQYLQAKNNKENLERRLATTREQLEKTRIKSPIEGVVDRVAIKEGEAAAAGFGAIRVVQNSNLKIKAQVSEKYILSIHTGDSVDVIISGIDLTFRSRIIAVSNVIDPDARTFVIEVSIPADIRNLANNMLAVLKINDYTNENAITVPIHVIQNTGEEEFLFIAVSNDDTWRAEKRLVHTGMKYNNLAEITSYNVEAGEMIITAGFQNIADGQALTLID